MEKLTRTEKIWNEGKIIYDNFASQFIGFKYSIPSTQILETIALLSRKKEKELLLRVMMNEFVSNLSDERIVLQNKKLFHISEQLLEI